MRLARRALVAALTTLMRTRCVSSNVKNENDPRNTAPTVVTGGTPGANRTRHHLHGQRFEGDSPKFATAIRPRSLAMWTLQRFR